MNTIKNMKISGGDILLPLRWVIGWTYFSAFWRRVALADKLDPDVAGYVGEKFNHFLPNALFIKPMIEALLLNPDWLLYTMIIFTIVEGLVGMLFIFGFATRLMSFGVVGLALGILLSAGWIGTTCLDEWQIGVLGVAGGISLLFAGGGRYSMDYLLAKKMPEKVNCPWFKYLFTDFSLASKASIRPTILASAVFALGLTLATNQIFHGGVWGTLHNKSVKPKYEISEFQLSEESLSFELYRTQGADVYGSFWVGMHILDQQGETILHLNADALQKLQIENRYIAQIKASEHAIIVPLGAKAKVTLQLEKLDVAEIGGIRLLDVNGSQWEANR